MSPGKREMVQPPQPAAPELFEVGACGCRSSFVSDTPAQVIAS